MPNALRNSFGTQTGGIIYYQFQESKNDDRQKEGNQSCIVLRCTPLRIRGQWEVIPPLSLLKLIKKEQIIGAACI